MIVRLFTAEQELSPKTRAQLRQVAGIFGFDEDCLRRMTKFFVARIRADKRVDDFFGGETTG